MSSAKGFDGIANFDADPTASLVTVFNQLAIQNNWKKNTSDLKDQRARFVAEEFGAHFGRNLSALQGWQMLCRAVGTAPEDIPPSIAQCKKVGSK